MTQLAQIWVFVALLLPQSPPLRAGTRVEAKLQSPLSTNTARVGDEVFAVLVKPIATTVPRGSRLHGRVETIAAATLSDPGRIRIVFRQIEFPDGTRIPTWITESFTAPRPRRTVKYFLYTLIGGGAGALIGGHAMRAGAAIGGAIIGFVLAADSGDGKLPELTLRPGSILHLQLGEDLVLR